MLMMHDRFVQAFRIFFLSLPVRKSWQQDKKKKDNAKLAENSESRNAAEIVGG